MNYQQYYHNPNYVNHNNNNYGYNYNSYPNYRYPYPQNQYPIKKPMTEEEKARKELKGTMNGIGVLLIVAVCVFFLFSIIFALVYSFFIGSYEFSQDFDSIAENLLGGISNVLPIGACGFFYIMIRKPKASEVLLFEKTGIKKLLSVIAIGFSVCMLSNLLTSLFMGVTSSVGVDLDYSYDSPVSNSPLEILVYFISVAVVPAFSEEILFRGAILSALRKYGDGFAVMVSAFFFGIFHGNLIQFPFAMIVGMVQGWAFVYTNSLLPAILIHFMNNGFSVLSDVMSTNAESAGIDSIFLDYISYALVISLALVAIVSAAYLSKKDKNFLRLKKYEGCLQKKEIKSALLTSPTVIIATVLLAFETLSTHLTILL